MLFFFFSGADAYSQYAGIWYSILVDMVQPAVSLTQFVSASHTFMLFLVVYVPVLYCISQIYMSYGVFRCFWK